MKKLYEINSTHYAPKDSHTSIQEYVVANNDRKVFEYLAKGYAYWEDMINEWEDSEYDSKEDAIITYEEIYDNKGDDREVYDLYYGATQYSWEEVQLIDDSVIDLMIKNNLAKEI